MHIIILGITSLLASRRFAYAVPTWPAVTDELEDILFLNTGYRSGGFASAVTPCSKGISSSRVTAAEWLRTAFHDSISGNVYTGVGGLDGSIAWEVDTLENEGSFAVDSVSAWAPYVSDLTSLSDVIAAATYALTRSCSNISIAVRGGRVDATEAGPSGFIPQPQNAVSIFRNQFARMGLDDQGMVQFVACGHTIGGVHGADHPEITNQDLASFDTTPYSLDNSVAVEYISGTTNDPLVVGKSTMNTRNSDFRVFSQTDNNATIRALAADPNLFASACQSLFQKMIDFVPAGTQLTDPIIPYEVKPYALQLTLLDGGSKTRFTGDIRIRMTQRSVSQVQLSYADRNGALAQAAISTTIKGTAAGFDDKFSFFSFSIDLPAHTSISAFNVTVTYSDSTRTTFDNNGAGFQVEDNVIYQAPQSCLDGSGKLTVVAAVRNNQAAPDLRVLVKIPQASPNPVPSISTTTVPMATQSIVGSYQLYSAELNLSPSKAYPPVFGVFAGSAADTRKGVSDLPTICATLATSTQGSSSPSSPGSSSEQPTISSSSSLTTGSILSVSSVSVTSSNINSSSAPISSSNLSATSRPTSLSSKQPNSIPSLSISSSISTSPTPTSTADFTFRGCYYDGVNPRALAERTIYDDNMTVEECAAACMQYQYFGLEYMRECYCGNALDIKSTQQSDTECNMLCGGNSAQLCGGSSRISLYENLEYAMPSIPQIAGYDYKGCYSEGSTTRALLGNSFSNANMTVEICSSLCSGVTYFGVEYSQECYCGNALQTGSTLQNAIDCTMRCSGNTTQYCGGSNRLSLYKNSSAPVPLPINPSVANYTYQGCYIDSVNARVLYDTWEANSAMTIEKCVATCSGYTYFGAEYGSECYCGDTLGNTTGKVAEGECGMTCGGNATEFCGSINRLTLYRLEI